MWSGEWAEDGGGVADAVGWRPQGVASRKQLRPQLLVAPRENGARALLSWPPVRSLILVVVLAACEGRIAGSGDVTPVPTDPNAPYAPFHCDPPAEVSATPLRRLSTLQYRNTLRDLFSVATGFDALTVAGAALNELPVD